MPDYLVISNTSPLLYLHQVGQLELLPRLYGQVQIPSAVREELRAGAELGVAVPDVGSLDWLRVQPLRDTTLLPVVIDLGSGEHARLLLFLSSAGMAPETKWGGRSRPVSSTTDLRPYSGF